MNGGHKLRILSSENDASVKVQQDQNTNITLKLEQPQLTASQPDLKVPVGAPINIPTPTPTATPPGFIAGAPIPTPAAPQQDPYSSVVYPSAYQVPVASPVQERDIDLTADIADKDAQITVLEALLACYENNPVMINKFVVCKYETLMDIIKVLTGGDKVEFQLDEDKSCTCCNSKYIYISKIFVTKDGKAQEFKHGWNEKYSLLQRHGISLKICTN